MHLLALLVASAAASAAVAAVAVAAVAVLDAAQPAPLGQALRAEVPDLHRVLLLRAQVDRHVRGHVDLRGLPDQDLMRRELIKLES